jgi:hypothetical protein
MVTVGNKLAPRFADWYLARTGYASQQIATTPIDPDRPNNLFEPVPNLAATHGMFDEGAHSRRYQLLATPTVRSLPEPCSVPA